MEIERASAKMPIADFESLKERFLDLSEKNCQNELNIIVTGKIGVGKSRLVNCMVGKEVAKEGRDSKGCTSDVTPYSVEIDGINVRLWDSPGLQDDTPCDEELYLTMLTAKLEHGFDVMICCIKMDDKRFYVEDKRVMETLTRGFGENLWKRVLIALTFANRVEDPDEEDKLAYFSGEKAFWKKAIDDFLLSELKVPPQLRSDLPIIPAGNKNFALPTGEDWLAELWTKCLFVTVNSAGLASHKIKKNPLKRACSREMALAGSNEFANADMPTTSDVDTENWVDIAQEGEDVHGRWCCIGCGIFGCQS